MAHIRGKPQNFAEVEEIYTSRAFKYEKDFLQAQKYAQEKKLGIYQK